MMNTMTNGEIINYFQDLATSHVRDSISNSQQDEGDIAWMTRTDSMGRLAFRTSADDFDGPQIQEMMDDTRCSEAQVRVLLEKATQEAFDYEFNLVRLEAEISELEAEDA
jgi:hypothetical protein